MLLLALTLFSLSLLGSTLSTVQLAHTNDYIIINKESNTNINKCIEDLQSVFDVEDEGTLEDCLGEQITKHEDGTVAFTQPRLINSILEDLDLINEDSTPKPNMKTRDTPALSSRLIGPDPVGEPFNHMSETINLWLVSSTSQRN